MGKLSKWAVALALAAGVGVGHAARQAPTEEQVRQLMEVVGVGKMMTQMNAQAVGVMQQSLPCVPGTYWQNYIDASATQQFIGRLVPIWQKHFTADEMEGMLKFYRSPLGQKVIAEMPTTMAEATQAGLQWSHERSEQMLADLKQRGSLDARGRCPATVASGADQPGDVEANEDEGDAAAAAVATKATPKKATSTKGKAHSTTKTKAKTPAKATTKNTGKTSGSSKPATKPATSTGKATGSATTTDAKPADKAPAKPAAGSPPSGG